MQGCVGPSFSVYTIPVLNHLCRKCTVLPSPYIFSYVIASGLGWGWGGLGGKYIGGGWVKAEGEAVEMRAVNSVSVGLRLCFFFFF